MKRSISWLAALTISFSAAGALALDLPAEQTEAIVEHTYELDGLSFTFVEGQAVGTQQLRGELGPVDVITIEMLDPQTGVKAGSSFLSISRYSSEGAAGSVEERPAQALAGVIAAFEQAFGEDAIRTQQASFDFGGRNANGVRVTIEAPAGSVEAEVAAFNEGGETLVIVQQIFAGDERFAPHFAANLESLQLTGE